MKILIKTWDEKGNEAEFGNMDLMDEEQLLDLFEVVRGSLRSKIIQMEDIERMQELVEDVR